MEIQRGVTTRRIFANLEGYATRPIMIGGVPHSNKAVVKDHVETGGAYTNAPAISYYQMKRTQQNDNGDVVFIFGSFDVTYFNRFMAALSWNSTCQNQYMAVGLFPASHVPNGANLTRTPGQHIKDIFPDSFILYELSGPSFSLGQVYGDISALEGEYYAYAECWASDTTSTSAYAELALRTMVFEV